MAPDGSNGGDQRRKRKTLLMLPEVSGVKTKIQSDRGVVVSMEHGTGIQGCLHANDENIAGFVQAVYKGILKQRSQRTVVQALQQAIKMWEWSWNCCRRE